MFNWVRRYFNNRHRAIFKYWDGRKWRAADPLVAFRALMGHSKLTSEHLTLLQDPSAAPENMAVEAFDVALEATRDVFGITAWTEKTGGLTTAETRNLLMGFMGYILSLKKSGSPTPTSPEPTGPTSSSPSSTEPIVTNASPDSPSMPSAPISVEPLGCC